MKLRILYDVGGVRFYWVRHQGVNRWKWSRQWGEASAADKTEADLVYRSLGNVLRYGDPLTIQPYG